MCFRRRVRAGGRMDWEYRLGMGYKAFLARVALHGV